eukprot:358404-Chlamydomonas_euryale.AAC.5
MRERENGRRCQFERGVFTNTQEAEPSRGVIPHKHTPMLSCPSPQAKRGQTAVRFSAFLSPGSPGSLVSPGT